MSDAVVVGSVQRVDLEIHQDADLVFDVEWWADQLYTTPNNLSAIDVWMELNGVRYDLDTLGHATFLNNVVHIFLPAAFTAALAEGDGKWRCEGTHAASLEQRVLAKGLVKVRV